ncbi:uncharacterized protein LOC144165029 [Haemaphysalis longicornis]
MCLVALEMARDDSRHTKHITHMPGWLDPSGDQLCNAVYLGPTTQGMDNMQDVTSGAFRLLLNTATHEVEFVPHAQLGQKQPYTFAVYEGQNPQLVQAARFQYQGVDVLGVRMPNSPPNTFYTVFNRQVLTETPQDYDYVVKK